jgi:tetratricopeptide (TPR) repeat protein
MGSGVPSLMTFALLALALLVQDPDLNAPNLQPPPDTPKEAVAAVAAGAKLMEEARKAKTDPLELVEKAIVEFRKADRVAAKTWPAIHFHLGICHQWTKEYTEARRRLERALEMRPNFHEAMVELGDVCAWLKDYSSAVKTYDRALAIKADYALAHRNKAISLIKNDDYKGAKEALDKAAALDAKDSVTQGLSKLVEKELEGPGFGSTKFTKESAHFVVECDADQAFTDWISKHLELIYAKYSSIFPQQTKPKAKFRCIVYKDLKEYLASGAPPNTGGYYQDLTKKLVFYRQPKDSDTQLVLYHEAFHQFLAYYLYGAPQWFNEGHGDYFGPSAWNEKSRQMEIRTNPWRLPLIRQAIAAGRVQPFEKLMLMTQAELYDPNTIAINYAQSWSVVYFLWHYENGKYARCLQLYFKALNRGAGLRDAFAEGFGKVSLPQLEKEWKEFTLSLK